MRERQDVLPAPGPGRSLFRGSSYFETAHHGEGAKRGWKRKMVWFGHVWSRYATYEGRCQRAPQPIRLS